ncbi:MAG TPA: formyl transferase [Woeseiaceae bacterium]|nr:formyl transferase [Woeseiaceae bacterium]
MKIVLLGHEDLASVFALRLLMSLAPQHDYVVFFSGPLASDASLSQALVELAAVDRQLLQRFTDSYRLPDALRTAGSLPAPNSPEGLATLAAAKPDLLVSIRYRRILQDAAIALPAQGVLNLHSGILPDYKGVMVTFWAMLNAEPEIGCTLHRINDGGIDTGPVVAIERRKCDFTKSYLENVLALYPRGCDMVARAIGEISRNRSIGTRQFATRAGHYFSTPDKEVIDRYLQKSLYLTTGAEWQTLQELSAAHKKSPGA